MNCLTVLNRVRRGLEGRLFWRATIFWTALNFVLSHRRTRKSCARSRSSADADEAGLHHEAVAGAVDLRLAVVCRDLDHAREDVAKLESGALDRMRLARRRLPDAGEHLLDLRSVLRPGLEGGLPEISRSGTARPSLARRPDWCRQYSEVTRDLSLVSSRATDRQARSDLARRGDAGCCRRRIVLPYAVASRRRYAALSSPSGATRAHGLRAAARGR